MDVPAVTPEAEAISRDLRDGSIVRIDKLLTSIRLASSGKEANRKLSEGAVEINGEKHDERGYEIPAGVDELVVRMGKKWARVRV